MNIPATVAVQSWAGIQHKPCRVIGETPERYRIDVNVPTALPPGYHMLQPGETKLVPKYAVSFLHQVE